MDSAPQNRYDARARRHSGARPVGDVAGPASIPAAPPPVPHQQPVPQYAQPPYSQPPQYPQAPRQYTQPQQQSPAGLPANPPPQAQQHFQSPPPQQQPQQQQHPQQQSQQQPQSSAPGYGWNPTTVQVQVFPQHGSSGQQEAGSQAGPGSNSHASPPAPVQPPQAVSMPAAPAPPAEYGYYPHPGHQYAAPHPAEPPYPPQPQYPSQLQYPAEPQYQDERQYTGTPYPAEHESAEPYSGQPDGWPQADVSGNSDQAPEQPGHWTDDSHHGGGLQSEPAYHPAEPAGHAATGADSAYDTAYEAPSHHVQEETAWSGWADTTDEPLHTAASHADSHSNSIHTWQDDPESSQPRDDSAAPVAPAPPLWACFSRGVGLFLGTLALAAVAGELRSPLFDGSLWWIELGRLPLAASRGLLAAFGVLAITFGVVFHLPSVLRRLALSVTVVVLLLTLSNVVEYFQALRNGTIVSGMPVPLSLHVAACLALLTRGLLLGETAGGRTFRNGVVTAATLGLCAVAFPLCQIFCDGQTDHRQPAAAIAVFGCGVDEQGRPSDALRDRMRTAAELYHAGLAPSVILSGGPGPGTVHETEAMQNMARAAGIPAAALHIDRDGYDTLSTVRHLADALPTHNPQSPRVLLVSHFFHLPRIATYSRQHGLEPLTVPAPQQAVLRRLPWFVAREIPALWVSHARSLTSYHHGEPAPIAAASPSLEEHQH